MPIYEFHCVKSRQKRLPVIGFLLLIAGAFGADIKPGKVARVSLTPQKVGDFEFHCDNFCGSGHADMRGMFHVVE